MPDFYLYLFKAINGLGNQQDVTDAADAKQSKCLDYKALKELVNLGDSIERNQMRLTDHSHKLADHTTRIAKLETTAESKEKGDWSYFFKAILVHYMHTRILLFIIKCSKHMSVNS